MLNTTTVNGTTVVRFDAVVMLTSVKICVGLVVAVTNRVASEVVTFGRLDS